ncbi:MAG: ABC transporter ATP-binding protein [Candidatus Woesearchaeota archaeon]|jgi:ABC-2 type transport system ATP-binding protein
MVWEGEHRKVIIELKDIRKSFGKKEVLKGISLSVEHNKIIGLIGKSGSGKTVLLNILIGNLSYDSGEIFVNVSHKNIKSIFGFSVQNNSFYEELTLKENLDYFGALYNLSENEINHRSKILFELLDLELDIDEKVKNLSGGMKKRFDFCCALLHDPEILILDEPTTGLDPLRRAQLLKVIENIKEAGTTVIMSTHFLDEIEYLCDKVLVLESGEIIEDRSPKTIIESYGENEKIILKTYPGNYSHIIKKLNHIHLLHAYIKQNEIIILTPKSEVVLKYLLNRLKYLGEQVVSVEIKKPTLDEVFQKGFKHHTNEMKNYLFGLKEAIDKMIKSKYSDAKIRQVLMDHGWPEEILDNIIAKEELSEHNNSKEQSNLEKQKELKGD